MTTGRGGPWVALGALTALALGSAALSVSTAPTGTTTTTTQPATVTPSSFGNGAHFTVSPVTVRIGQSLRLAGTKCSPSFQAAVSIGDNDNPADSAFVTAAADGSWTAVMTVGDATPLGNVDVTADCVERDTHGAVFRYAGVPIRVSTFRTLAVRPGPAIDAGSTLSVSSVGACPPSSPPYDAGVHLEKDPNNPTYAISAISALLGPSGGEWSAELPVPATMPPGSYVLLADCEIRRAVIAYYRGVPITVTVR